LTAEQLRYAFDDVRHLLALWRQIADQLQRLNRNEWAREEFLRMQKATDPEELLSEKWRRLRGLGSLDRRRLAIARALYQWREDQAERNNRPSRTILRDDLIIEIARRNPTRDRDLQVVRGLPRREVDAILETVAQARTLSLDQCPVQSDRDQDPPQVGLVASILQAVLGDLCVRLQLAPNLAATTQDVKSLVRARLAGEGPPEGSLLTHGWRQQHLLPELQAVLEGRRLIRIANVRAEAPLTYQPGE
jgi:ribonuclease D